MDTVIYSIKMENAEAVKKALADFIANESDAVTQLMSFKDKILETNIMLTTICRNDDSDRAEIFDAVMAVFSKEQQLELLAGKGSYGVTALHEAAGRCDGPVASVLKIVPDAKAAMLDIDKMGRSPMEIAVSGTKWEPACYLYERALELGIAEEENFWGEIDAGYKRMFFRDVWEERQKKSSEPEKPTEKSEGASVPAEEPEEEEENPDYLANVLLCGGETAGKTALLARYTKGTFSGEYKSTFFFETSGKLITLAPTKLKLAFTDLGGRIDDDAEENDYSFYASSFMGLQAAVIVIDASNEESLVAAKTWKKVADIYLKQHVLKFVIVTKIDLPNRKVTADVAKAFADEFEAKYFEVSALDGTNVNETFKAIGADALSYLENA